MSAGRKLASAPRVQLRLCHGSSPCHFWVTVFSCSILTSAVEGTGCPPEPKRMVDYMTGIS